MTLEAAPTADLATRQPGRMVADPSRVIAALFVPGHYLPGGNEGRASGVVGHVLALRDDQVYEALADLWERFGDRHRDLTTTFAQHADRIGNRVGEGIAMSEERRLLLGATFTHEYAVEAAAVCNPSVVAAPDQTGVPSGSLRIVMSVRQIGEGHRSSIGFRTGLVDEHGVVALDPRTPFTTAGVTGASSLEAASFRGIPALDHHHSEATAWVLDRLGDRFTADELGACLLELEAQRDTRRNAGQTARRLRELAARTYTVEFAPTSELGERVLHPTTSVESNGMEDARFVRFVDEGETTYYATYTAFDGAAIVQQLLTTTDLARFTSAPLLGAAAANKGFALFPRRIGGRFAALSRHDGASNAVAFSDTITRWPKAIPLDCPTEPWEAVQVGNCGPPIETDAGWLVLTHGVGPMRTYSIGAWLLDLDDPTRIIGRLRKPLLTPQADEQDGYVPNVVYSCGGVLHGATLVIPYGIGDASIGFATVPIAELLDTLVTDGF